MLRSVALLGFRDGGACELAVFANGQLRRVLASRACIHWPVRLRVSWPAKVQALAGLQT